MLKVANIVFVLVFVASSCSKDEDEYAYSTLTTDFVMLHTSAAKTANYADTDNDIHVTFNDPLSVTWATAVDTTYRALLYYNKVEGKTSVEAVTARSVGVLYPRTPEQAKKWFNQRDPLDIAAAWRSNNGKWLNFKLSVKTGTSDESETSNHTIGLVCDSVEMTQSGRILHCFLCHDQNNIPAYYTSTAYASIPIENPTDSFVITVTTWTGDVTRKY